MHFEYHLLTTLPSYLLICVGLVGIFKKAGESPWKALVPIWNLLIWLKIVGRKSWWTLLFFIPGVNLIMGMIISLDLIRSFGKSGAIAQILVVIFPFIYLPFLGFSKVAYQAPWASKPRSQEMKAKDQEWVGFLLVALTAVLVIRSFFLEPFRIPTTSMEGSLKAGDFLFVSKFHYGVRLPMVPLAIPFIHNKLPFLDTKSYSELITLPYSRLPGIRKIKRNDIVVFNYPANDIHPDAGETFTIRPPSLKQNYIKRCVALPGDEFEIKDRQVYINKEPGWNPAFMQQKYTVVAREQLSPRQLQDEGFRWKSVNMSMPDGQGVIQVPDPNNNVFEISNNHYEIQMTADKAQELETWPNIANISYSPTFFIQPEAIFPHAPGKFKFTTHNFGPITIPKRGATIKLDTRNINLYTRIIEAYEHHDLKVENGVIKIDGIVSSQYTFEMDYYFMMGDNRDGSLDGRFWGFVPEDHIVGRPFFILFSMEDDFRSDRFFKSITNWEE